MTDKLDGLATNGSLKFISDQSYTYNSATNVGEVYAVEHTSEGDIFFVRTDTSKVRTVSGDDIYGMKDTQAVDTEKQEWRDVSADNMFYELDSKKKKIPIKKGYYLPYRSKEMKELHDKDPSKAVIICNNEKEVDYLLANGQPSTTFIGGAKWANCTYLDGFRSMTGKKIILVDPKKSSGLSDLAGMVGKVGLNTFFDVPPPDITYPTNIEDILGYVENAKERCKKRPKELISLIENNDYFELISNSEDEQIFFLDKTSNTTFKFSSFDCSKPANLSRITGGVEALWFLARTLMDIKAASVDQVYAWDDKESIALIVRAIQYVSARKGIAIPENHDRGALILKGVLHYHLGEQVYCPEDNTFLTIREARELEQHMLIRAHTNISLVEDSLPKDLRIDILKALRNFSWEDEYYADLFLGFLVSTLAAGVLDWRPQCWIVAPAGSGKTKMNEEVSDRFLGEFKLESKGDSTSAGIRLHSASHKVVHLLNNYSTSRPTYQLKQDMDFFVSCSDAGQGARRQANHKVPNTPNTPFLINSTGDLVHSNKEWKDRFMVLGLSPERQKEKKWSDILEEYKKAWGDKVDKQGLAASWCIRGLPSYLKVIKQVKAFMEEPENTNARYTARAIDQYAPIIAGALCWTFGHDVRVLDEEVRRRTKLLLSKLNIAQEEAEHSYMECLRQIRALEISIDSPDRRVYNHKMKLGEAVLYYLYSEKGRSAKNKRHPAVLCLKAKLRSLDIKVLRDNERIVIPKDDHTALKNSLKHTEFYNSNLITLLGDCPGANKNYKFRDGSELKYGLMIPLHDFLERKPGAFLESNDDDSYDSDLLSVFFGEEDDDDDTNEDMTGDLV